MNYHNSESSEFADISLELPPSGYAYKLSSPLGLLPTRGSNNLHNSIQDHSPLGRLPTLSRSWNSFPRSTTNHEATPWPQAPRLTEEQHDLGTILENHPPVQRFESGTPGPPNHHELPHSFPARPHNPYNSPTRISLPPEFHYGSNATSSPIRELPAQSPFQTRNQSLHDHSPSQDIFYQNASRNSERNYTHLQSPTKAIKPIQEYDKRSFPFATKSSLGQRTMSSNTTHSTTTKRRKLAGSKSSSPPNFTKGRRVSHQCPSSSEKAIGSPIRFSVKSSPCTRIVPGSIPISQASPMVQGVALVQISQMPDRFRSVFPFPFFNVIQSKCFTTAYKSDKNLVVSAPTGGGKTAILEMAICRQISKHADSNQKVIYMAPTKSLCSERQRDWASKFSALGLQCSELTGDTDHMHLRSVQRANIVVTTPEKWDSVTRKWNDRSRLVELIGLVLIDEAHILKDDRGATLEAVVARMRSATKSPRFVALSATIPNSEDIAAWLSVEVRGQQQPAIREVFGDELRPVILEKHIVGIDYKGNDWGMEKACDQILPEVIAKYTAYRPMMVFCTTRKAAVETAKLLAQLWTSAKSSERYWQSGAPAVSVGDSILLALVQTGVAFHHAGLSSHDRQSVESGFLKGQLSVICCTSTLATGVNLPCHFVIIKNTVSYQGRCLQEYSPLEVTQMLGRAGRPQFDDSAVAVIITKQSKVRQYERLTSNELALESRLHENLIEHFNAEISLRIITDLASASKWLSSTFLYVRMTKNPELYQSKLKTPSDSNANDQTYRIIEEHVDLLVNAGLVNKGKNEQIMTTEFGDAMARYSTKFGTMKLFLALESQPRICDILSALVQADEYEDVRLKAGEKKVYKLVNEQPSIMFPIKVDIALHAHKRSLIIQAELGDIEFPSDVVPAKTQYLQDKTKIFSNVQRLTRCFIDCQIAKGDAIGVRNGLELARSLSAQAWDSSPFQMKQLQTIGPVAVRRLCKGGILGIEDLSSTEPHRIEMLLGKNPPFGTKLLEQCASFPKLRVSLSFLSRVELPGRLPVIKFKAEYGLMNEKLTLAHSRKPIHICIVTERSDGFMIDFRRISAKHLEEKTVVELSAELMTSEQFFISSVMCDEYAGTLRSAELKPALSTGYISDKLTRPFIIDDFKPVFSGNFKSSSQEEPVPASRIDCRSPDDFDEQGIEDTELLAADFAHIDDYDSTQGSQEGLPEAWNPRRLSNGKWDCNHRCKDKMICKHFCCREGVDKPPKPPKGSFVLASSLIKQPRRLSLSLEHGAIQTVDLTGQDLDGPKSFGYFKSPSTCTQVARDDHHRAISPEAGTKTWSLSDRETMTKPQSAPSEDFGSSDELISLADIIEKADHVSPKPLNVSLPLDQYSPTMIHVQDETAKEYESFLDLEWQDPLISGMNNQTNCQQSPHWSPAASERAERPHDSDLQDYLHFSQDTNAQSKSPVASTLLESPTLDRTTRADSDTHQQHSPKSDPSPSEQSLCPSFLPKSPGLQTPKLGIVNLVAHTVSETPVSILIPLPCGASETISPTGTTADYVDADGPIPTWAHDFGPDILREFADCL